MHSAMGPWNEAAQLYVSPTLPRFLVAPITAHAPLVIYDVGLGIGANALQAIEAYGITPGQRPLQIISFENDLGGMALALENLVKFPFLQKHEEKIRNILKHGSWTDGNLSWNLIPGNFETTLDQVEASPDILYYDFYSPGAQPHLWELPLLDRIRHKASSAQKKAMLFTYSASTSFRSALFLAGFYVGYGPSTEFKRETTVASMDVRLIDRPLSTAWFEKLKRSSKRPSDENLLKIAQIMGLN